MRSTDSAGSKFKLHVSFAEADIEFVDNLLAVLGDLERFDLSVTPGGQDEATDWVHDAGGLIEAADAIVYVLSPASVELPTIAYEAERAGVLSKRMVPVISQPLRKADLPAALSGMRPVRMETQQLFKSNLRLLLRLLDQDAGWIRLHTQLFLRARSWQDNAHDKAFLLNRSEVSAAKAWTFERSADAPKPTDLHMEFIAASETAAMGDLNGAHRAYSPAAGQRARRKPKPAVPQPEEAITESKEPCETASLPAEKTARAKPKLWEKPRRKPEAPAKTITADLEKPACVPEDAEKEAHFASPTACTPDDVNTAKSPPDNAAAVITPAEDAAEPESPSVKKTANAKPRLWKKLRRKPKAPAKAIAADLEKPACVPEEAAKEAQLASPTACAPDDASTTKSRPDNEAAVIKPAEDAAEPESPPVKKTAKAKPRLWKKFKRKSKAPAKTIAADLEKPACVPEDAEKEAHLASPAACAPDDVNTTKSRPDNEADVITPAEDTAEPESPPVKETIRTEPGLWKFKRKPKMPARTITVDLEKLAYVPEALKILRTSDGQLKPPPPAKPAALPDTAKKETPLAGPTAAPADTGNVKIRPDNEAAKTRLPDDVAEPESLPEAAASDTHESPLKTAPKPKTANPVIIAQDELDGLLSSLLAEADSDRS